MLIVCVMYGLVNCGWRLGWLRRLKKLERSTFVVLFANNLAGKSQIYGIIPLIVIFVVSDMQT